MFSYAKILYAVGQILDEIDAKGIAIHEQEEGLLVEGFSGDDLVPVEGHYSIADLYDLVSKAENKQEEYIGTTNAIADLCGIVRRTDNLKEEYAVTPTASSLYRFLAKHNRELVGASP
ncbi:MAG TPA: hypothetical protein VGL94_19295 [Ktedonobacteraceae bacterium]|jgi:hypothetical protein